jgi:hypothetical protein
LFSRFGNRTKNNETTIFPLWYPADRLPKLASSFPAQKICQPYELENVITTVPSEGQSSNLGSGYNPGGGSRLQRGVKTNGLLGYDVLKHFLITVDYDKFQMHIYAQ